jgi:hypothetical protein
MVGGGGIGLASFDSGVLPRCAAAKAVPQYERDGEERNEPLLVTEHPMRLKPSPHRKEIIDAPARKTRDPVASWNAHMGVEEDGPTALKRTRKWIAQICGEKVRKTAPKAGRARTVVNGSCSGMRERLHRSEPRSEGDCC